MASLPFQQLHDSMLEQLGQDIVSGALAPGTTISADEVATRYDVSRTVIREVVRVLESLGLASVRRRVGITILGSEHWNALDPTVIRWQLAAPAGSSNCRSSANYARESSLWLLAWPRPEPLRSSAARSLRR